MNNSLLNAAKEEFCDKLHFIIEYGEVYISSLNDSCAYRANIDRLFRVFHSLKPSCHFLNYHNVSNVVDAVENVLSALRLKNSLPQKDIIDWLFDIYDYLSECYSIASSGNENFNALDFAKLNRFSAAVIPSVEKKDILGDKTLCIFTNDADWALYVKENCQSSFKDIFLISSELELKETIIDVDILIVDIYPELIELVKEFKGAKVAPVLAIAKQSFNRELVYNNGNVLVDAFFNFDIQLDELLAKLNHYGSMFYEEKLIKAIDKKISSELKKLKPIPDTVAELQKIANSENSSLRDITKVVSKEPVMSAKILEAINSPLYCMTQRVDSVNQAVTLLGKDRTINLCIQASVGSQFAIDVSPYGIDTEEFYKISQLRSEIAMGWFSKVSFFDLPIISTTALIGSIGQVLISKIINEKKLGSRFKELLELNGRINAEIECVGAMCEDITAEMLSVWGMNPKLIASIKYAYNFVNAPEGYRNLAVANFIIFTLVPITSTEIDTSKLEGIYKLASEYGLKSEALKTVVDKILENKPLL